MIKRKNDFLTLSQNRRAKKIQNMRKIDQQQKQKQQVKMEEEEIDINQTRKLSDQIQELKLGSIHTSKVPSSRRSRSLGQEEEQQFIVMTQPSKADEQQQEEVIQQQQVNQQHQDEREEQQQQLNQQSLANRVSSSVLDFTTNKNDTRTRNQTEKPKLSYQHQPRVSQSMMSIKPAASSYIQTHNKMSAAVANFRALLDQSKQYTNNMMKKKDQPSINLHKQEIINSREFLNGNFISPIKPKKLSNFLPHANQRQNNFFIDLNGQQSKASIDLLSPLHKKALQFDGLQISMATALRYVKTSDLIFLLQDYQPDKKISAAEFKRIVQLLKDSVLGNDSNLPQNIFQAAVAQLWEIIQKVQRREVEGDLNVSNIKEEKMTWASIKVVAPAVILFTRGSIQERLDAIFDTISEGKKLINYEQTEKFLCQIYELMLELGASPLKASQNKLEPSELATHAARSIYRTIGHNPDTQYISAKLLHIWLLNPISPVYEEDNQQEENGNNIINQSGYQLSNQSTLTCGVDNSLFKTFGELKKKMVQKPAEVPPLDLKNTQALKKLQDKCNKMISIGTKLNQKEYKRKDSKMSIVNTSNTSSSSCLTFNDQSQSRKFNQPQRSKRNKKIQSNQSASQSLERLPSQRGKTGLLSPNRRIIPQKVKKFSKLCVVDLDLSTTAAHNRSKSYVSTPKYKNCTNSKAFKESSQYESQGVLNVPYIHNLHQQSNKNLHSKCQSMFLQTKQFKKESLTQFYKNFQQQMDQIEHQQQQPLPLSPVNKIINIPDIHIKSPEDKLFQSIKIKKCQDEVRFSVEQQQQKPSINLIKSPYKQPIKTNSNKQTPVLPKTLMVKVNDSLTHQDVINNKNHKVSQFTHSKQNSISSSLATFAPNKILGSPQKKRNIKIAVLDYFLKH